MHDWPFGSVTPRGEHTATGSRAALLSAKHLFSGGFTAARIFRDRRALALKNQQKGEFSVTPLGLPVVALGNNWQLTGLGVESVDGWKPLADRRLQPAMVIADSPPPFHVEVPWVQVNWHPYYAQIVAASPSHEGFIGACIWPTQLINPWQSGILNSKHKIASFQLAGQGKAVVTDESGLSYRIENPLEWSRLLRQLPRLGEEAYQQSDLRVLRETLVSAPSRVGSWYDLVRPRDLGVVISTIRPRNVEATVRQVRDWKLPPGWKLRIAVGFHGDSPADVRKRIASILNPEDTMMSFLANCSLGECLNELVRAVEADVIAKVDDDDLYGPEYAAEALHALGYSGADIVGKRTYIRHDVVRDSRTVVNSERDNMLYHRVAGATLVFPKETWEDNPFPNVGRGEDTGMLDRVLADRGLIYSSSRENFEVKRYPSGHTWLEG